MSKLISYAYLRKEVDISQSVDDEKLDNPIKLASMRLEGLLGSSFYNELVTQYTTTPTSFSTDNNSFFDPYVKQFIAWKAYEIYFIRANTMETRIGLRVFKEDNSDPASDKVIGEQLAMIRQHVQMFTDRMINFLRSQQRASSTKYPLYTQTLNKTTGSGFGITAVSKSDTVSFSIENSIVNQEP